ncbi:hypothetical protein EDC27_2546 [Desulfosoma caldarium]|uniref:Uncharacterized protein n=2 Tax=Desulfosoma caldarium TaxID=610254 RepID=A0A3N1UHD1_9BACT|nr:hypothetical protein EDC27_2546 [Desulfosoma caldarium]
MERGAAIKESVFLKGYFRPLGLLLAATLLFVITLALGILEHRRYRHAQEYWRAVQAEEEKVRHLEAFAATLAHIDPGFFSMTPPREAVVEEKIALEPFSAFVEKLSRIYTDQGYFFMDSFVLETCDAEGNKSAPSRSAGACRPHADVRGKKVYFQP